MNKALYYMAALIGLFLVIVYYKGFAADTNALGGAVGKLVLFFQGRDSQGNITDYPKG